jgi:hypothetical protein
MPACGHQLQHEDGSLTKVNEIRRDYVRFKTGIITVRSKIDIITVRSKTGINTEGPKHYYVRSKTGIITVRSKTDIIT